MINIKCPFCNGELVGTIGHPICRNQDCVMCDDPMPKDLLEELIRTRRALNVAVDALKRIKFRGEHSKYECCKVSGIIAQDALEQIIALTKGGDNE